jgi:hypothetical protein
VFNTPGLVYRNPQLPTIPHGAGAPVRRLEAPEVVPVWSAALERQGAAAGLSAYVGNSSIYHSPAWGAGLERGDCLRPRHKRAEATRLDEAQRLKVEAFLRCGLSLRQVARRLALNLSTVRRVNDRMRAKGVQL